MTRLEKTLLFLYILPLSLDFKGAVEGGNVIQFIYLSTVLLSALLLFIILKKQPVKYLIPKSAANLNKYWWFFLASTFLTMLINQVPIGNYVRVVMPFILSGISTLLVLLLYSRGKKLEELFKPIILAIVVSVLWTPFYALFILQVPISEMRHQLLSPLLPMFIALGLVLFVFDKFMSYKMISLFTIVLILVLLSVTRANILIFGYLFVFLFACLPVLYRRVMRARLVVIALPLICFLVILIPIAEFIRPEIMASWWYRLFGTRGELGFDVTAITRLSEYSGQMELLFESPLTAAIGRGMGSVYLWDYEYFDLISQVIPLFDLEELTPWFAGHSVWVYSLYSGGLLFGLIVPYCLYRSTVLSWNVTRNLLQSVHGNNRIILVFFSLIVASVVAASFTANPFSGRIVGLLFGFGLVLPLLFMHQLSNSKKIS